MSLIRERFLALGDAFDVLDEHGTKLYRVDGKVFSVRDKVVIEDPSGDEIAAVSKRWLTLRDRYAVRVAAGVEPLLVIGAVLALDLALERDREDAGKDD